MNFNAFPTATSTWGDEERKAILECVDSGQVTMGPKTRYFEQMYADYIGSKYCVSVNSGSSANLLMVGAYTLRYGRGTVAVPAIGWSTSYSPFQQYGWKLKFIDVNPKTLNVDVNKLSDADLILGINLLGNPNDFAYFPPIKVLEDNCESMGAEYFGRKCGTYGVMSSHSTYFAHHMCTMEGGMITTDDEYFYHMLLSLRSHGWTRHLPEDNLLDEKVEPFRFIYPGYNVRPTEMQSVIGIEQLKKLPTFVKNRHENYERFTEVCQEKGWGYQVEPLGGYSSSFGCALFTEDVENVKRDFKSKGIEFRPIMSGNFTKSPSIRFYDYESGDLSNSDEVERTGIFVGNHHYPVDWSFI